MQTLNTIALAYIKLGRVERVIEIMDAASKDSANLKDPSKIEALWRGLFQALCQQGEWNKMQQVAMKLSNKFPQDPRYADWVVACMLLQGPSAPSRALAPRFLTKLQPLRQPDDALSLRGGTSEVPARWYTERKLLEAEALMDTDPDAAITALSDPTLIVTERTPFLRASLLAKQEKYDEAWELIGKGGWGLDKLLFALDIGIPVQSDDKKMEELSPSLKIRLRAYERDPNACKEYLEEYGDQFDAFFHIRPFLGIHCNLQSLDDNSLKENKLLNIARAHYVRRIPLPTDETRQTDYPEPLPDFDFPSDFVERVGEQNADTARLMQASLLAERGQYRDALKILEKQSLIEVEVRRSLQLKFLLYGWLGDTKNMLACWDTLEIKNISHSMRHSALAVQWLFEQGYLPIGTGNNITSGSDFFLTKIVKMTGKVRNYMHENQRECTDKLKSCFIQGPMHRVGELYALYRDQGHSLSRAVADTTLSLIQLYHHPEDLAALEEVAALDYPDIHDTDTSGMLHELVAGTGLLGTPWRTLRQFEVPAIERRSGENLVHVHLHPLLRPDLFKIIKERVVELHFLRELHRLRTDEPTHATTEEGMERILPKNPSPHRPSFEAAVNILHEGYENAVPLLVVTNFENIKERKDMESIQVTVSRVIDLCCIIWIAKWLPKSKKRSSALFKTRQAIKNILAVYEGDSNFKKCVSDLGFRA